MNKFYLRAFIFFAFAINGCKQIENVSIPSVDKFADGIHHWNIFNEHKAYVRLKPEQYIQIADNFLAYQNLDGGWPKNIDWLAIINIDSVKQSFSDKAQRSTLDNNNVFPQIEYLAKVYTLCSEERFKTGALKGIQYLFKNEQPKGCWRGWDVDAITYNDQVMTGVMNLFYDIYLQPDYYKWLPKSLIDSVHSSLQTAIDVTLHCQIVLNGTKTAWCQQHHKQTYEPVKARSYELPSITARESVDVVRFLMRIDHPSDEVVNAVKDAVKWLKMAQLSNLVIDTIPLKPEAYINEVYPYDLIARDDSAAQPIWARYYDLTNSEAFLCTLSSKVVYSLSEISPARRTGYAWYGYWPQHLIEHEYPAWLQKLEK